jgi:hypothetical protein
MKKIVEVHWSDERESTWYWVRRVRDGETEEAALWAVRELYTSRPRFRYGDLITPTFRVREIDEKAPTPGPSTPPLAA